MLYFAMREFFLNKMLQKL